MSEGGMETQRPTQELLALGRDGEPCAHCGSPLAVDQRYCLNCGARRGGPRVDYRERMRVAALAGEPAAAAAQAAPAGSLRADATGPGEEPEKPVKGERDYAPLAAVGGIAVLGLMLLIGVLIGRGDGGDSAPAPAPVVVQGGGASAGQGEAGGAEEGEGAGGPGGRNSGGGKQRNAKGGRAETAAEAGAVTASESQLEELQSETGEAGAKNALKLPDKIATPGAPPPIDKSKPPGGGEGGAVTIE